METKTTNIIIVCVIICIILLGTLNNFYSKGGRLFRRTPNYTIPPVPKITPQDLPNKSYWIDNEEESIFPKEDFMEGCVEDGGGNPEYCICVYDYLIARTTDRELMLIFVDMMDGKFPDLTIDATEACISLFDWEAFDWEAFGY